MKWRSSKVAETVVNAQGGAQAKLEGDPKLIPAEALLALSEVVALGAKRYAPNNWRLIPMEDHISHALEHLFLFMDGQTGDEDHLKHALCRLAFAMGTRKEHNFKAVQAGIVLAGNTFSGDGSTAPDRLSGFRPDMNR
jgi:dATP/dGTP diphosphohydrolase